MKQIIVNARTTEKRIAVIEEKKLLDFMIIRPVKVAQAGQIYLAQIEKIDRKINACFVTLGKEKGFLHLDDIPEDAMKTQGGKLLVQVVRPGSKTKLPLVSGMLELTGEQLVYIYGKSYVSVSKRIGDERKEELIREVKPHLQQAEAVILRSKAETSSTESLVQELTERRQFLLDLVSQSQNKKKTWFIA
ncbi:ribonuclease [Listeria floridensis FSL S10-1187]|uniref:Ribonuclease n=1 Tax=Listeria floridensis FSL S10-1187 TaxID=1265817 RepID=A0ABP3B032_9LIST|nr:ribonuclease E/G [Listeria floridensis]EUJ33242.1 ribonuclease [Listeria floridensis FSL S10-1187]